MYIHIEKALDDVYVIMQQEVMSRTSKEKEEREEKNHATLLEKY